MNPEPPSEIAGKRKKITHIHLIGVALTLAGLALFIYFVASVGVGEILAGIARIGFDGFALILFLYFLRLAARAVAWKLSVAEPYKLGLLETFEAICIGEALSTIIPLGILISGTAKAVAVRRKVPLVVGFSSVATENLFYSFGTGILIISSALVFLKSFALPDGWAATLDVSIGLIALLMILGFLMIIRQWHIAGAFSEWLYNRGILRNQLETGRAQVRIFEQMIYGFYRRYPQRFAPIFLMQIVFHALGVVEVWFILSRISDAAPSLYTAFLLESISRIILVVFKLIPFSVGVGEAGAQYVTQTLGLGATVGIASEIIRKGRVLFWAAIGIAIILWRGLSISELAKAKEEIDFFEA